MPHPNGSQQNLMFEHNPVPYYLERPQPTRKELIEQLMQIQRAEQEKMQTPPAEATRLAKQRLKGKK